LLYGAPMTTRPDSLPIPSRGNQRPLGRTYNLTDIYRARVVDGDNPGLETGNVYD